MKHKKRHITLFIILIWSFSFAQQLTNYTTKDGLPSNHIYKVTQDANGFIWIATDRGLVKYNGSEFKTFTTKNGLAINDVWGLNATPDGKLWFQSKAAKVGYVENDSVHVFESETKGEIFNSVFTSQIGNEIILSSSINFHKLQENKWRNILENNNFREEYYSNIQHKNISRYLSNNELDTISFLDKEENVVKQLHMQEFLTKRHKRGQLSDSIYFWVNSNGYKILNLNTLQFYERTLKEEININTSQFTRINLINNQLQISGRGFVGILDNQFRVKDVYYFPKKINAHFAMIDVSQNIWICTFSNGLYKLPKIKRGIKYSLTDQKVNHIAQVKDKIVATVYNKGFYVYNSKNKQFNLYFKEKEYLFRPNYLEATDTQYYFSQNKMFAVKNEEKKYIGLKNVFRDYVINAYADRQFVYYNNFIYGIYAVGVNKIDPETHTIIEETMQYGINYLAVFKNMLLVATTNGLKQFKNRKFEAITFKNQQLDKSILNIHKISNTEILLNTDGFGAYITDLNTIKPLPNSEFLIVNNAFVKDNSIWLATNKGILEYEKNKDSYVLKKQIDISNGLPSNNINDVFIIENDLLVSTNSGVAILPKNQENKSQLLDIYFENATYNNQKITVDHSVFDYTENNSMNISISSLDFSEDKSNLLYNYKLEPIQKEWIYSNVKTVNYNDLKPGNYNFTIQSNGIENCLDFEIKPLWWQTLWFKLLCIILFISLIVFIIWFLIRQLEFKKNQKFFEEKRLSELQLKALRSQMNPHFVFNSLAAIQYYINNNQMEASEAYLVKFSKLIRQFFEWSKEKEISIVKEIELLSNYLDIEKLRFKDKFEYAINLDKKLNAKSNKLPTMLLQPIVENAINHGIFNKIHNGNVTINFIFINEKSFKIEIIDDGVGFVNTKKQGNRKVKSSNVLEDRLRYLNQTNQWEISYSEEELNPNLNDKGNKSTFIITQL